jgi:hypothetical protein
MAEPLKTVELEKDEYIKKALEVGIHVLQGFIATVDGKRVRMVAVFTEENTFAGIQVEPWEEVKKEPIDG